MRTAISCIAAFTMCGLGFVVGQSTNALPQQTPAVNHDSTVSLINASFSQPDDMEAGMIAMMDAGTPGEHHRALDPLIGEFEGFVRITMFPGTEPMEMPSTMKREWILDGHYIKETVTSDTEMGQFEGIGIVGYNNLDGVYEVYWIDNMSTAMMFDRGTFETAKQTLHVNGMHRNPMTGTMMAMDSHLDVSDPDRQIIRGNVVGPDGSPYENFYGVFERVN